jgi:hypothetical protein
MPMPSALHLDGTDEQDRRLLHRSETFAPINLILPMSGTGQTDFRLSPNNQQGRGE